MDALRRKDFLRALNLEVSMAVDLDAEIAETVIAGADWPGRLGV
jgi:hypothetical protein